MTFLNAPKIWKKASLPDGCGESTRPRFATESRRDAVVHPVEHPEGRLPVPKAAPERDAAQQHVLGVTGDDHNLAGWNPATDRCPDQETDPAAGKRDSPRAERTSSTSDIARNWDSYSQPVRRKRTAAPRPLHAIEKKETIQSFPLL